MFQTFTAWKIENIAVYSDHVGASFELVGLRLSDNKVSIDLHPMASTPLSHDRTVALSVKIHDVLINGQSQNFDCSKDYIVPMPMCLGMAKCIYGGFISFLCIYLFVNYFLDVHSD